MKTQFWPFPTEFDIFLENLLHYKKIQENALVQICSIESFAKAGQLTGYA